MQATTRGTHLDATSTTLAVGDELRRALGQELHDGLGQLLVGASLLTRSLLDDAPTELRSRVQRLATLLDDANRLTHSMASGWSPWLDREATPSQRIVELSRQISETFQVTCRAELGDALDGMDPEAGIQVFLIVREAVMNAVRHSGCSTLSIVLRREGARRKLAVRDDGHGPRVPEWSAGFGVRSMQARASALGGELQLRTPPHGGLEVCCEW